MNAIEEIKDSMAKQRKLAAAREAAVDEAIAVGNYQREHSEEITVERAQWREHNGESTVAHARVSVS